MLTFALIQNATTHFWQISNEKVTSMVLKGEKNTACHSVPLKVCLSDTPVCQCNLGSEEIVWRCCTLLKLDGRSQLEVSTAAFSIPLPPEMGIPLWALNFCFFFPLADICSHILQKKNKQRAWWRNFVRDSGLPGGL